jgi:asparagine synthase (glutamine-hydrolysing)
MSGILGVWNSQKNTPWQPMFQDLRICGSDGSGDWHHPEIGLSLGRTQFFNTPESCLESAVVQAEGCVLVWDGRLDDRDSLLVGRSQVTDAQLMIEAYRRWGVDCLCHLVGEYAFILWDASQDRLLVGCDKAGGRTLAYYWDGQTLLVASRAIALLHHPQVSAQLNELFVAHSLGDLWAQPPGLTSFQDIQRLLPGHALIIQSGQFQHRKIAEINITRGELKLKSPEAYYERFWELLDRSVQDRLRTIHPVCTTLSGGLDSTTITVSLLNNLPSIDAFSSVTDRYPEFDERPSIQSFLQRYPQTRWHPINCNDAWTFREPYQHLPATDDPFTMNILSMHLRQMKAMKQAGVGVVFEGENGDELFYTSIRDQARAGNWREAFRHLQNTSRWHSVIWREILLPYLPQSIQTPWIDRWLHYAQPLASWFKPAYVQSPPMQQALRQFAFSFLDNTLNRTLLVPITLGGFVGGTQASQMVANAYQLDYVAPFADQRLVEFAFTIPPILQSDATHEKIFLRRANQGKLPDDVQWRPKENYFDPLKYAAIGEGEEAVALLEAAKNCQYVQERVDFVQVESRFWDYRKRYANDYQPGTYFDSTTSNNLATLISFYIWYEKLQNHLKKSLEVII